jgi:hypothetical protein
LLAASEWRSRRRATALTVVDALDHGRTGENGGRQLGVERKNPVDGTYGLDSFRLRLKISQIA